MQVFDLYWFSACNSHKAMQAVKHTAGGSCHGLIDLAGIQTDMACTDEGSDTHSQATRDRGCAQRKDLFICQCTDIKKAGRSLLVEAVVLRFMRQVRRGAPYGNLLVHNHCDYHACYQNAVRCRLCAYRVALHSGHQMLFVGLN